MTINSMQYTEVAKSHLTVNFFRFDLMSGDFWPSLYAVHTMYKVDIVYAIYK